MRNVAAVWARDNSHLDLFTVNRAGTIISTYRDRNSREWRPWFPIGARGVAQPGAYITAKWSGAPILPEGRYHLDLFTTSRDDRILSTYQVKGSASWRPWFPIV